MSAQTGRADLDHAAVQLGLDLVAQVRARDQHLFDVALQLAGRGIDELELFLDAEGEGVPASKLSYLRGGIDAPPRAASRPP